MKSQRTVKKELTPSEAVADALIPVVFRAAAVLNMIGADNDLSFTQLRVLGILWDRRLRMAELAGYLGLKKSTMTGLIDRAEKKGLVERAPSADDSRAVDVMLTADGAKLVSRLQAQVLAALAPLTDRLNVSEQGALAQLLQRMLAGPEG